MTERPTVGFISLGCSKNLVDSEYMLGILARDGFSLVSEKNADVIVINTCGFISTAIEESGEVIAEVLERKQKGSCKKVIVAGCLPSRDSKKLVERFPEVDHVIGTNDITSISEVIKKNIQIAVSEKLHLRKHNGISRMLTNTSPSTYVKISDGCSNGCTYCTIPIIKGPFRSRTVESIESEVKSLARNGIQEVNLISQDTTAYGKDIGSDLTLLLSTLNKIKDIKWLRLLYCYPERFTDNLIDLIKDNKKICKYLDIPLQHVNDKILKRMGRKTVKKDIENLLNRLRKEISELVIRTTFIVGFPGETDKEFMDLYNFVKDFEFECLGAFKYSREDGTPAANYENQIPEKVKEDRYGMLMELQSGVSLKKNKRQVGAKMEFLGEGYHSDMNCYYGRVWRQAPDVDGITILKDVKNMDLKISKVEIINALEYDLIAKPVE